MSFNQYDKRMTRLDEQLRSGAADRLTDAQHAQIEAAAVERLRQGDSMKRRSVPTRRHWRAIAFGVAAAAMVLLAAMLFMRQEEPEPQPLDIAALVELWEDSETLTRQIPQWTRLPDHSMQAEMTRLNNDARRAVAFLMNCAPGNPMPETANGR